MLITFTGILLLLVVAVIDASAAYLGHQQVDSLADGAALRGADLAAQGTNTYRGGVGSGPLSLTEGEARQAVLAYLRDVGAARHRDADVGGRQRRGVVDVIADLRHDGARALELAHDAQLVLRQELGPGPDAERAGDGLGRAGIIAGQHDGACARGRDAVSCIDGMNLKDALGQMDADSGDLHGDGSCTCVAADSVATTSWHRHAVSRSGSHPLHLLPGGCRLHLTSGTRRKAERQVSRARRSAMA